MMKFLLWATFIYVLACFLFYFFQHYLLFQKQELPLDYEFKSQTRQIEELWLGNDGEYHALLLKAEDPVGLILYFHGNRGNLVRWIELTEGLQQRYSYDIMLVEFPGFGKSKAALVNENFFAMADLAMQYASSRYNTGQIILYGRSMGSGIASWLASKHSVRALILETPYETLHKLIGHYAFFLPHTFLSRFNFEPSKYLRHMSTPVYILHGTNDNLIPVEMARRLTKIRPDITNYTEIESGEHNNLSDFSTYWEAMDAILM